MLLRSQLPTASCHPRESLVFTSLSHAALWGSLLQQTPPCSYPGLLRVPSALRCEVYYVFSHLAYVLLCKYSHRPRRCEL